MTDALPVVVAYPNTSANTPVVKLNNLLDSGFKVPRGCYIFCDRREFPWSAEPNEEDPRSEAARREILRHFDMPELLHTNTCVIHNGYFGCRPTYENTRLVKYSTWFRVLAKKILREGEESEINDGKSYVWYEMGFYTLWEGSGNHSVLCVGMPRGLPNQLREALRKDPPNQKDPFALHIPLLDLIVKLQDDCVWRLRDPVRKVEKRREQEGVAKIFEGIHDVSRHAIHISEVLAATVDTFDGILKQGESIYRTKKLENPLDETYREQALENLSFQVQMIKSLKLRNDSNNERLKSEIGVAYNTIAQQDNTVMKSIALLTMVFLPATFVSAFFSTTFFSFGDDGTWRVSKMTWVYVVVAVPVTVMSVWAWQLWLSGSLHAHLKKWWTNIKYLWGNFVGFFKFNKSSESSLA